MPYKQAFWIDKSRKLPIDTRPKRVWTVMLKNPTEDAILNMKCSHLDNAFLEERYHDWDFQDGILHYYSRISDGDIWLLLEY